MEEMCENYNRDKIQRSCKSAFSALEILTVESKYTLS